MPQEPDQRELLAALVEVNRKVQQGMPRQLLLASMMEGDVLVHPRLERDMVDAWDVRALASYGLIRQVRTSGSTPNYEVTNEGRRYYAWMKQQGEPVEQVEAEIRRLVESESFRARHPAAHERRAQAQKRLWEAETVAQFTDIGHACREAIQRFVTELAEEHAPEDVDRDPQHTVARLRAVMIDRAFEKRREGGAHGQAAEPD